MPRRFLNRVLPARAHLRKQWFLRPFSALLHDPALWATHRKNVLKALAIGIFACFLPFPGQAAAAAVAALWMRVNVAVAVATSWLANPLTMPALFYGSYRLGAWILDRPPRSLGIEISVAWLGSELGRIWQPLLLGCVLLSTATTAVVVLVVNRLWIARSRRRFRQRRPAASG